MKLILAFIIGFPCLTEAQNPEFFIYLGDGLNCDSVIIVLNDSLIYNGVIPEKSYDNLIYSFTETQNISYPPDIHRLTVSYYKNIHSAPGVCSKLYDADFAVLTFRHNQNAYITIDYLKSNSGLLGNTNSGLATSYGYVSLQVSSIRPVFD